MSAGGNSCVRRFIRRVYPGANPLRRRTDWFETVAFAVGVLAALLAVVLTAIASQNTMSEQLARVQAEETSRRQVSATVVTRLKPEQADGELVVVRWGEPGRESFGATEIHRVARPGDNVPVWVDRENRLVSEPMSRSAATQAAGVTGASVLIGCVLVGGVLYAGAQWWVTRRRLAAWEAEWAHVGPRWRRRTG